jgi:hypothetical protein
MVSPGAQNRIEGERGRRATTLLLIGMTETELLKSSLGGSFYGSIFYIN